MKTYPKFVTLILAAVMVITLAAGCAPGASPQAPASAPTDASQAPASAPTDASKAPETAVENVDKANTIRMAVSGEPLLDPALASYWAAYYPYLNVYDALTKYDHSGELKGSLSESWESSTDGMTWTFKLFKGVKFHDGSEVKASDVVFSINRMLTVKSGISFIFTDIVKKAETKDDYTVVFKLEKPDGVFDHRVSRLCILNEKLVMANISKNNANYNYGDTLGDYGITFLLSHDAGSGPYMATEVVSGNSLTTVQYPEYRIPWDPKAPKSIVYINNNVAATQGTMLSSDELDISDNWQNNDIYQSWEKSIPGIKIAKYSDYSVLLGFFNTQKAPTDDVYVRKAIMSLVDYDSIIKNVLPFCSLAYSPIPRSMAGASQLKGVPYPYDLEKAKAYLAQSKYAKDIANHEIEVFLISGSTYDEQIGLMMQEAANQVGINLKLTSGPFSTLIGRVGQMDSTPHISMISNAPNYNDPSDIFISYFTKASQGTVINMAWTNDDKYEKMVADAVSIVDKDKRYAAYAEIEEYLNDQAYAIYFGELTEQVAYRETKIDWQAANDFVANGKLNYNIVSFHYWFPEWKIK